jgi:hypothetical protein
MMIRQKSKHRFSSIKNQCGDASTNIVLLLAFALLALLLWQFNQSNTDDDTQQTDPLVTTDGTQTSQNDQRMTGDPLQPQKTEGLDNKLQQAEDTADREAAQQNEQDSPENRMIALDESDDIVREEASELSNTTHWQTWLGTQQSIRKFVQFMENVSRGKVPHKYFKFLAPSGQMTVDEMPNKEYSLDSKSYKRYNQFANTIDSLDTEALVYTYTMLKPFIETAWDEMKTPGQSFDEVVLKAIKQVQTAPAIREEIRLIRPSVMYKFADTRLEQLNAVSKQMLRMGPRNTRIIQKKLDAIEILLRARQALESEQVPDLDDE